MRARNLGTALLVPVTVLVVWWFLTDQTESIFYPSLRSILVSFRETWLFSHFGSDIIPTLYRVIAGFALATAVGVGLGLLLGRVRRSIWPSSPPSSSRGRSRRWRWSRSPFCCSASATRRRSA